MTVEPTMPGDDQQEPRRWFHEFVFSRDATGQEEAGEHIDVLVAAAKAAGFEFEVGHSTCDESKLDDEQATRQSARAEDVEKLRRAADTPALAVMRSARGRVNHYARRDEINMSLCGVELVGGPDDVTAWTLCAKCKRSALLLPRKERPC